MSLNESEACAVDVSMIENIESDVHFLVSNVHFLASNVHFLASNVHFLVSNVHFLGFRLKL